MTLTLTGFPRSVDTIDVLSGWNMIGSVSSPVPKSAITSIPGGLVVSNFFGYNNMYSVADTIKPGAAYWVKVNQPGKLILSASASPSTEHIRIVPTEEMPPPPPSEARIQESIPYRFALGQNYPNPFNPITTIRFEIGGSGFVTLKVFNVLGQAVTTLVNEELNAGSYETTFDANSVASGMYYYRLHTGEFTETKKMVLMK